jgi:hypothetical protein
LKREIKKRACQERVKATGQDLGQESWTRSCRIFDKILWQDLEKILAQDLVQDLARTNLLG